MRAFPSALLLGSTVLALGCAGGSRRDMQALTARQDTILARLDAVSRNLDSTRESVQKIRLLTDFLGARIARQERIDSRDSMQEGSEASQVSIDPGESFARGAVGAPVTMVTFSDLECPYCRQLAPVLDSFSRRHESDLRWVAKNFPLDMHENARMAAVAAIAAGRQGRYFEFCLRSSFERGPLDRGRIDSVAKAIGLDMKKFRVDFANPRLSAPLLASEINQAGEIGVKGTPSVYMNGRLVRAASVADLEKEYLSARSRTSDSREKQ